MFEKKIAVIGVGNILLGDEGLGVNAVKRLQLRGVPKYVTIFDAGTSFHLMTGSFCEFNKIVVVDAVRSSGEPGTIYRFTIEELESDQMADKQGFMLSLHELNVPMALKVERLVSKLPSEVVFLGMEPEKIDLSLELSETISGKMEELVTAIEKEFS